MSSGWSGSPERLNHLEAAAFKLVSDLAMRCLIFLTVALLALGSAARAQPLYFPPLSGSTWDTTSVESLGWQRSRLDSLYRYLNQTNTKAFIVLKNGRIVIERYFDSFTRDSLWYWASAGKSLTALLVGIAQEEGLLNINQRANFYMGNGWTSATLAQENAITVRNQLTMSSGLNDVAAGDRDCWSPPCLPYLADAGTRWAYHNGPYTLLDSVMERATGVSLNNFHFTRVRQKTGMTGFYLRSGPWNNVMFSNPRSFARFGLLILGRGMWNATAVLSDTSYFRQMTTRSQNLNRAYGYLWWLNGSSSYMVPQLQTVFPGMYAPSAPPDMYAAIGRDGQICAVVPSQGLVVVRMGENPGASVLVPTQYTDDIFKRLNYVAATTSTEVEQAQAPLQIEVYPNPVAAELTVSSASPGELEVQLYAADGRVVAQGRGTERMTLPTAELPPGLYVLHARQGSRVATRRVLRR